MPRLEALSNPALTTVVLVTRADPRSMQETARTSEELRILGLSNQRLAVNGVFHAYLAGNPVAMALEKLGRDAMDNLPDSLVGLPRDEVPLRPFDMVGLSALRAILAEEPVALPRIPQIVSEHAPLQGESPGWMADELAAVGHGLTMMMGKDGVGRRPSPRRWRLAWCSEDTAST